MARRRTFSGLALALSLLTTGVRAQTFTDISEASGLNAVRAARPDDWWVSGLHFVDLDGDDRLDVFLSSHGSYGALAALGDGNGKFRLVNDGYPTTEIHIPYDIDEDGKVDLSTTYQDGGGQFWLNASSPGSLDFTETDVKRETNTSRIQVMLDVNQDGNVDWVRASETEDGVIIDYGDGKGGFEQGASQLPGLGNVNPIPVDIDGDGDKDWVTSWGDYRYEPGQTNVYREDGNLELVDVTTEIGLATDRFALQGVGDFDNDGDSDFIAIEDESFPPSIFLNDGTGHFQKLVDAVSGVPGQPNYPTWGLGVVTDLDNDGKADIVFDGRNYLHVLLGVGGGKFRYMNDDWNIENTAEASVDNGFAFGDIDADGDLDLLGWREIYPERYFNLYRNDLPARDWVRVRIVGLSGHKGAPGAKVRVYAAGTDQLLWYEDVGIYCRQVQPGYGYHFAETERHYGLGTRATVDVSVEFYPSRKLVKKEGVTSKTTVRIGEDGDGVIVTPPGGSGGTSGSAGISGSGGASEAGGAAGAAGGTTATGGASGSAGTAGNGGNATSGASGNAGLNPENGDDRLEDGGGCGCRTPSGSGRTLHASLFVFIAGSFVLLRRRRARRRHF
jgi:hypothetical protein